jgi:hypothetical protein
VKDKEMRLFCRKPKASGGRKPDTGPVAYRMHNRGLAHRAPGSDATERANCRSVPYTTVVSCLLSCSRPRNSVARTAFPNRVRQ